MSFQYSSEAKKKIQKPASPVFQIEPFAAPSLRLFRPIFFFFFAIKCFYEKLYEKILFKCS